MCTGVIMTVISTGSHHLYTPIWRDRMSSAADGCRGSPGSAGGGRWTGEGVATTRRALMRASGRRPEPSRSPRRSAPACSLDPRVRRYIRRYAGDDEGRVRRCSLHPMRLPLRTGYGGGPMTEELGWSRTEFTLAQTVGQIVSVDSKAGDGGPRVNPSGGTASVKSPAALAGDRGFEPRPTDPESAVLPLDESPADLSTLAKPTPAVTMPRGRVCASWRRVRRGRRRAGRPRRRRGARGRGRGRRSPSSRRAGG